MPVSEAKKKANSKWNASKDNIMVRVEKETGSAIRVAASNAGQSVTQYILSAVGQHMAGGALPLNYQAIKEHIQKTGETVPAFVVRAVHDTIQRDNVLLSLGLSIGEKNGPSVTSQGEE